VTRGIIILAFACGAIGAGAWAAHGQAGGVVETVKVIDVTASRFKFEPAMITVDRGDTVRLRLRSTDRLHALAIKPFRVNAAIPSGGEIVTVEFVADRAGTFPFTCSEYCGTGHSRMLGKLVVKGN
jgi:cytochrome c oxidase subunit 2